MKIKTLPNLNSKPATPSIGARIKVARTDCGISQEELAIELSMETGASISLIESDLRNISAKRIRLLAHITNKPIDFFFV